MGSQNRGVASLFQQSQAIYDAVKDDPAAQAQLISEHKALAIALATNPEKSLAVTSASVNGQSFSGSNTMTNSQRLLMLRDVVQMIENGGIISEDAQAFWYGNC